VAIGEEIILHLVWTPYRGNVGRKPAVAGLVGGASIVAAGVLRVLYGGQSGWTFLMAILAGLVIVGLVVLYGYLRFWNATVFLAGDRIGVTNALGLRHSVAIREVDSLLRKTERPTQRERPIGILVIVTKDPKRSVRFAGGNRLEPGGIERIAERIHVPIQGSW
jgi:hypothetical protein